MVDLLIYRGIDLCKDICVIHSTSNSRSFRASVLVNQCSLPLYLGTWDLGHDIKRERKPALSHDVVLTFVFREDDFQTTRWLARD